MMGSFNGGARLLGAARWGRLRVARRVVVAAVHLLAAVGVVLGTSAAPAAAAVPVPPFVQVDNGSGTSCGLTADGQAYCWGRDDFGAVGNGPGADPQYAPVPVDAPDGVVWSSLSVGGGHTCALTTTGAAYCWGGDYSQQLGNGPGITANQHAPGPVVTPSGVTWATISTGLSSTCAITTVGQLYCWGGMGDDYEGPTPNLVPGGPWADVVVGYGATCAVTTVGTGFCWGIDFDGRLGNGPAITAFQRAPSPVAAPQGVQWARITPGEATCGITTSGAAYCWGRDTRGTLGNGPAISGDQPSPSLVDAPGVLWTDLVVLQTGASAVCALSDAGAIYCWGSDSVGQQANGPGTVDQASPGPIVGPPGVVWASLSGGGHNACAAAVGDPTTYCWGTDFDGALGDGLPSASADAPTPVGAGQTIDFAPIADVVVGAPPFTVAATASSGQPVTYQAVGPCSVDASTITPTAVGTCTVTAVQAGGNGWGAASAARSFTIRAHQDPQAISLPALPSVTYGAPPFELTATASSGLTVVYDVTGSCAVAGSTLTITGAGTCDVTASQAGNESYEAAASVTRTVMVHPATLTITAGDGTMTYGGASPTVTPSYSGFVGSDGPSVLTTAAVCGGGTPTTTAGVHASGTSCSGATAANYAITYVPGTLTVAKATLTVTADPKSMVHGQPVPALTASTTGFLNGETAVVLSGSPALSTTATSTSGIGTYPITVTQGGLAAQNYSFSFVPGTLTVTPAATILTVDPVILRTNPLRVTLGKVTARLSLADPALPLAGHTITFTSGTTVLCTATTTADGTATCQLPLVALLTTMLAGGYQAAFAGTPDLVASRGTASLFS